MSRIESLLLMSVPLVVLVCSGCAAPAGIETPVSAEPAPPPEAPVYHTVFHEARDENDVLLTRREVLADADGNIIYTEGGQMIEHGVVTNFWPNGKKRSKLYLVHGVRHGPRTSWYENGQVWIQGQFVNGKEDGVWHVWYPDGQKAQEYHFVDGAWHGTFTEWHPNGQMKRQVEFVKGLRQGLETFWDEGGNVVRQVEYHDNVPQP